VNIELVTHSYGSKVAFFWVRKKNAKVF